MAEIPPLTPIRAAGEDDDSREGDGQVGIATKTRAKPKKPSQYKVLLLNDDYTPMEFVVIVLKRFFKMDMEEATRVMLHVHQKGVGGLRDLPLRGCRNQGPPGDGLRPAEPAPAAMHAGEGLNRRRRAARPHKGHDLQAKAR